MPKQVILTFLVLAGWQTATGSSTRLLRTPTVSATHIAFAYADNLWIVERAGGAARRLTSFQGQTTNPQGAAPAHVGRAPAIGALRLR